MRTSRVYVGAAASPIQRLAAATEDVTLYVLEDAAMRGGMVVFGCFRDPRGDRTGGGVG